MKSIIICFFLLFYLPVFNTAADNTEEKNSYMEKHPASYLKIHDYNVYATWSSVAILNNVEIENTGNVAYENIKVRIFYSSFDRPGNVISQETGIIPVTVPPHSKNRYLRAGIPFGGASQAMNAVEIQVLDAEVVN